LPDGIQVGASLTCWLPHAHWQTNPATPQFALALTGSIVAWCTRWYDAPQRPTRVASSATYRAAPNVANVSRVPLVLVTASAETMDAKGPITDCFSQGMPGTVETVNARVCVSGGGGTRA
jgi:hypothetical protein